ncbi:aspartyl-phosphate phosphatase Spo0E family protein [Anaerobacillus alkaliphilus]|uniref:Aspartyl-phosphate phosphatase Spo0E family protein n=1 Tax=Anaerobacillus alkaliphilus TaxID=1548597 RepID=A0A4V1LGH1_9BACI|nr:aspartyl-phosphate phosphatase Spo0E family protein [Anaerobacillus alkaliphilus]RXJ01644.1 aspartyl-phosphate phosphatase Spo0E family protein [Anaerobacillus alkaliphilus]
MPTSLLIQIEKKRKEMTKKAIKHGFSAAVTVRCSQELDRLLNAFDKTHPKAKKS